MAERLDDPASLDAIRGRLSKLQTNSQAIWGRMNAHQMVCHLCDSFELGLGEKSASAVDNLFTRSAMKWVALWAPMRWPRGIATRPEMDQMQGGTPPEDFDRDRKRLAVLIDRFAAMRGGFGRHPIFGEMAAPEWQRWGWLHCDHHFRQFGV